MIRKANKKDIERVSASYEELFAYEAEHCSHTNWISGVYPTKATAQAAFETGTLYVLEENGEFCGSIILNHLQPPEYQSVDWHYQAENEEVLVVHTLCIRPSKKGQGYGRQFVDFVSRHAAQTSCKVIRLDTWENNFPAIRLYTSSGFRLAGSGPMCLQGLIQEQQVYLENKVE